MNKLKFSSAIVLLICLALNTSAQNEPIKVFDAYRGGSLPWMKYQYLENAWYHHSAGLANQHLNKREAKIKGIKSNNGCSI